MKICGWNKYLQLDKNSNNKNSDGDSIINPPCNFHIDRSSIFYFSMNYRHAAWTTYDHGSYAIGDNSDYRISGLLPNMILTEDTQIIFRDHLSQPFNIIYVVCGEFYTLYLASSRAYANCFQLILCHSKCTPNPLFLNIGNRIPLSLFGGDDACGVVDTEGGIILISDSVFTSPSQKIEPLFLPFSDKPLKLACCSRYTIALGKSGRIYESKKMPNTAIQNFEEVTELSGQFFVDVSGTFNFCLAVNNKGEVFGRGFNSYCKLGMPRDTRSVTKFTKIESLKNYKIVSVFTGSEHSVFKTSEGKMIVCGFNKSGQLFISPRESVYPPEEVKICQGFNFCVAGGNSSAAFF